MTSMDDYRDSILELAEKRDGTPSYNDSAKHAAIVMEEMFSHARREINILSNCLDQSVYGQPGTVSAAARFLSAGSEHILRILVEDCSVNLEDHPLISVCEELGKCEIRRVPKEFSKNFKYDYNFAVADGDSIRFEPDRTKCAAIVAFGDKMVGQHLEKIFHAMWTHGLPDKPPNK